MRRVAAVDRNQPEIVLALRKLGATVLIVAQLKNAFDLLVGYKGKLHIMEIKDGELIPSKRRLTDGEEKCKSGFKRAGIPYHIVESIKDALDIVLERKL